MIVEYVASAYNQAPALPKNCFVNGQVAPENCSDLTWKIYLKHTVSEIVQPLLPIIPPTQNFVNTGLSSSGASPQARQIILPIASDANLTVMQMSRIRSNLNVNNSSVQNACRASGTLPANSPLCTGLIINSISFYRM